MATPTELRIEADMAQREAGGEPTTRACMLRWAADEIERLQAVIVELEEATPREYSSWASPRRPKNSNKLKG